MREDYERLGTLEGRDPSPADALPSASLEGRQDDYPHRIVVLKVVQSLKKKEFLVSDVYAHGDSLARLHPGNRHVHDKIRQQLQVLHDLSLLDFLGGGFYQLA